MKFRLSFLALLFFFTAGVLLMPSEAQKSGGVPPGGGKAGGGQAPGPAQGPEIKALDRLTPISATAVSVHKSRPAREIAPEVGRPSPKTLATQQAQREANPQNTREVKKASPTAPVTPDAALQDRTPKPNVIPGPALSFDGTSGATANVAPPDTQGDIGPNHYVMMTNRGDGGVFQVFNPTTGASILGPITLGSLFGGGSFPDINGSGDGIVVYDQMADRWLLSEFAFPSLAGPYHMSIAISETSDPTGSYFVYDFLLPTNNFPDYPKLAAWSDGYYMTVNQFLGGGPFNGVGAYAFNRAKMLVGDPTANLLYFDLNVTAFPEFPFGMLPSDADGLLPPPAGAPNVFMYLTDNNVGDPADGMRAFNFDADFDVPANSTFTERAESTLAVPIPLAAFNATNPGGRADVPQRAPGEGLDALNVTQLMFRLQYRNFGAHESWVTNFTVDVDATAAYQAGFRYVELRRPTGNANPISVNNEATFGPDTNDRWMGAASLDGTGNLAIVYNRSSASSEADIFWAGRLVGTPAGLGEGEVLVHDAPGVQTATFNRWGDYSGMNVDPDNDCTFWAAAEYYQTDSSFNWRTRIANFSFASCTPPAQGTLNGVITNCQSKQPIENAIVTVSGGPSNGFSAGTNATGNYSRQLSPGTYTVSATALGFSTATQMNVIITNGMTTTVDLCLMGAATLQAGETNITAEGCDPGNGAIDPGEQVTVELCLANTGGGDTTNLVGTLQATGGVTSPSGPQNYGVVVAGGAEVCRPFTFTAVGTCGGTIMATLNLQDGPVNLGSVSFTFQLGVPGAFSYTGPPVAIPDGIVAGVNVSLMVSGAPTMITDVNFRIDGTGAGAAAGVSHAWVGDLRFRLTSPEGTIVDVIDRPGDPAVLFGCSAADFIQTLMDDGAGAAIETACSPGMTGSFTPNNPLSAFNGEDANGPWTLNVADFATPDAGTVRGFSLIFNNLGLECCVSEGGGGDCVITCPDPITVSNDPDECGAVVTYPDPIAVGSCANLMCSPASGSFFPVGVTTVTCIAEDTGGGGGDKEVCQTSSFTGPPVAIPDSPNVTGGTATLSVTHPGTSITDLDFMIDGTGAGVSAGVDHTWVGDLTFRLTSPSATTVTIIDRPQFPASFAGCSLNDFFLTLLDDDGGFPTIDNACSNGMMGNFSPQNPLSAFAGEDPNGIWTLNVTDAAGGDTGNIRAFSLAICADGAANGNAPRVIQPGGNGCPGGGTSQTITHSASQTITDENSISCNNINGHADNSYWRAFSLNAFGITGAFDVESVDIGVEIAISGLIGAPARQNSISRKPKTAVSGPKGGPGQSVTVRLYTSSSAFPMGFPGSLTQIGTTTVQVADQALTIINIPVTGSAPAGSELVVEVFTPNGQASGNFFFIGSNAAGQTGPSFLSAAACGIFVPTPTATLGFPNMHIVMNVNGCEQVGGGTGPTCTFTITVNDTQPPVIDCPDDVTTSNDPDECGAVVNYPPPTVTDNCPGMFTATCSPASGSFFPVGTTTVTCSVDGAPGGPTCTFTITVNDTQPPEIECPNDVTAVTALTCPATSSTVVVFPDPTASDNCPGVTVACVPASGSIIPVGTTTVTCTATDASGNIDTCSFTLSVFDVCLQDDAEPEIKLLINSFTGDYRFLCQGNTTVGKGKVSGLACNKQLLHSPPGLRVRANWTTTSPAGNASLQVPAGVNRCVIEDRDMSNNDCTSVGEPPIEQKPGKQ